jgi:hypothetical protein
VDADRARAVQSATRAALEPLPVQWIPAPRQWTIGSVLAVLSGDIVRASAEADRGDGGAQGLRRAPVRVHAHQARGSGRCGGAARQRGLRLVDLQQLLSLLPAHGGDAAHAGRGICSAACVAAPFRGPDAAGRIRRCVSARGRASRERRPCRGGCARARCDRAVCAAVGRRGVRLAGFSTRDLRRAPWTRVRCAGVGARARAGACQPPSSTRRHDGAVGAVSAQCAVGDAQSGRIREPRAWHVRMDPQLHARRFRVPRSCRDGTSTGRAAFEAGHEAGPVALRRDCDLLPAGDVLDAARPRHGHGRSVFMDRARPVALCRLLPHRNHRRAYDLPLPQSRSVLERGDSYCHLRSTCL